MRTDGSQALHATDSSCSSKAEPSVCFTKFLLLEDQCAPEVAEREIVYATCAHVTATGKPTQYAHMYEMVKGLASGGGPGCADSRQSHGALSSRVEKSGMPTVSSELSYVIQVRRKSTKELDTVVCECQCVFGLNSVASVPCGRHYVHTSAYVCSTARSPSLRPCL